MMITLGTDAHKKSHTIVAVDAAGAEIGSLTVAATTDGHRRAVQWAGQFDERRWAIEDCRALSRRLETDLLGIGERVVRVPPKMMARARATARGAGKSDPIDALAVGRAALREPDLPIAQLDGPSREVRLLVDYRETLVHRRTGSRTSSYGDSTNSNPDSIRHQDHSTGTAPSIPSMSSSPNTRRWLPNSPNVKRDGSGNSAVRSTSSNVTSSNESPRSSRRSHRFQDAEH